MMSHAPVISIQSPDDPRIASYTRMKERDLSRSGDRFIAEGELVVRRLLSSGLSVESVLLATRRLEEIAPLVPSSAVVYTADAAMVHQIVGFKFHAGVMAIGVRPPPVSIDQAAAAWAAHATLVVLPEVSNTENMGAMIRIAAGLGADAILLGERCCNPYYRQSVRVSMGAIFSLPLIQSRLLLDDLRSLKSRHGMELIATVIDPAAESLSIAHRSSRTGILLGNEAQGLTQDEIALCDRRVTIPMANGIDSLNVAVAAGIILHHFTQVRKNGEG